MSESTSILKLGLTGIFMLMVAVGITALMSPLIYALADLLVSLTWYQAGIGFSIIGATGLYILIKVSK